MMHALAAEFRKLWTTRTGLWVTALSVVLAATIAILAAALSDPESDAVDNLVQTVAFSAEWGYIFSAVLGIIGLTGEYRHMTVTPTFLSVPRRGVVVTVKLVTYLLWGAVIGLLNTLVATVLSMSIMASRDFGDVSLSMDAVQNSITGAIISVAIFGVIGVGLGALLRNQIGAIVVLLAFLFIIQNLLLIPAIRSAYKFMPGALAGVITGADTGDSVDLFSRNQSILLLIAYGLVFAIVGSLLTVSRDVT
jgi:ABC-2 type transport system permease protein